MSENFLVREATIQDEEFLLEATINAEKGNGNVISYCALFDISEFELGTIIKKIFREEIGDFDFSVRSFRICECKGYPIGAYAGWVEGVGGIPSALLKMSAFKTFLTRRQIKHYESVAYIVNEVGLKRDNLTLQLETIYIKQGYRGKGIARLLTDAFFREIRNKHPTIIKAQVQLFEDNQAAFLSQSKLGFIVVEEKTSYHPEILNYMPGKTRVKMQKVIS